MTIEDNAELQLQGARNLVRLEARRANEEGDNEVTIRDLIRASLRMRPDRIIVGEVRGEETIDMLQSLNTGHDGSLSTGHGNSPRDMLSRLETMVLMGLEIPVQAVRRQIASGIDLMVHLGRMRDKSRKVLEILEITGYDYRLGEIQTHSLFEFEEQGEDEEGKISGSLVKKERTAETAEAGAGRAGLNRPDRDYGRYRLSFREGAFYSLIYLGLDAAVSFLFFRAWIPWLLFLGGLPLFLKDRKRQLVRRRGRDMQEQFLTGIQLVCTSLQAGYAVENAFGEALKELKKIYSKNPLLCRNLHI